MRGLNRDRGTGKKNMRKDNKNYGLLEGHCRNLYSRSFLKYTHLFKESKWNPQIIREIMPKINILNHQVKHPDQKWVTSC